MPRFLTQEAFDGGFETGGIPIAFGHGPGGAGILPLAGDWNNDGTGTVGLYVASTGGFFLKNTSASGAADVTFTFGGGGPVPLVGDWDNLP